MKILTLNLGSSSLKYRLFTENQKVLSTGMVDRIGEKKSEMRFDGIRQSVICADYKNAFHLLHDHLIGGKYISSLTDVDVVVHRVVHGGDKLRETMFIDKKIMEDIKELFSLSPLHNPVNYHGIVLSHEMFPTAKQVAVFDTGFYVTVPPKAYLYGLPYTYYERYGIRKYGFHGISHQFIASEMMKKIQKRPLKHISCHLGNGSSITAILDGKAVDTSMGFTPLEGVMMGTRSGSIDPAIIPFLMRQEKLGSQEIDDLLDKKSGIWGVSELSSDVRDIYHAALKGNKRSKLVLSMLSYQVMKYIGSFSAVLGGVDVITFTAGIGENAYYIRSQALEPLRYLGVYIDEAKNIKNQFEISSKSSKVKVFVLPTDEELQMYRETLGLLK